MNVAALPSVDVCLYGHGIACGLTVCVNQNCDVEISSGTAILPSGQVIGFKSQVFSYYLHTPSKEVLAYFPHDFSDKSRSNRSVLELVASHDYNAKTTDSLKQQHPHDLPTRDLLTDKIVVVLLNEQDPDVRFYLLVSPTLLLEKGDPKLLQQVKELAKSEIAETRAGLFKRPQKTTVSYSDEVIAQALWPYLQLPEVVVPRFGYKTLAINDRSQPFGTPNFVNPFTKITDFKTIFFEYKSIIDALVPEFEMALAKLHQLYGDQLTHKGADYWTKYRKVLIAKWQVFLEEGEHLYYIQYFYDWLVDLVKTYDELAVKLSAFVGQCHCHDISQKQPPHYALLRLGPVLGGCTSYTPVLFRDAFEPPLIDGQNADHWQQIKFLHWRMMMMIWTFDLPQLKLDEKVLVANGYLVPAKEFEDSTNYFEENDTNQDKKIDLEDLPLKFTPSQTPDTPTGAQAIPYYYPLDADSPFSLHRYWDYRLTQQQRTRHIRSYNAIEHNDSYTAIKANKYHKDAQFPLAFHLRQYPFLRAEGHIGKKVKLIQRPGRVPVESVADMTQWQALITQHNLTLQVVALSVGKLKELTEKAKDGLESAFNVGFEHIGGLAHGQTLVLVYADTDEQIELNECKKDLPPEVHALTIVADFTVSAFGAK